LIIAESKLIIEKSKLIIDEYKLIIELIKKDTGSQVPDPGMVVYNITPVLS